jgi:hypothetical protein
LYLYVDRAWVHSTLDILGQLALKEENFGLPASLRPRSQSDPADQVVQQSEDNGKSAAHAEIMRQPLPPKPTETPDQIIANHRHGGNAAAYMQSVSQVNQSVA